MQEEQQQLEQKKLWWKLARSVTPAMATVALWLLPLLLLLLLLPFDTHS